MAFTAVTVIASKSCKSDGEGGARALANGNLHLRQVPGQCRNADNRKQTELVLPLEGLKGLKARGGESRQQLVRGLPAKGDGQCLRNRAKLQRVQKREIKPPVGVAAIGHHS